jgi:hypothetical protein
LHASTDSSDFHHGLLAGSASQSGSTRGGAVPGVAGSTAAGGVVAGPGANPPDPGKPMPGTGVFSCEIPAEAQIVAPTMSPPNANIALSLNRVIDQVPSHHWKRQVK